jgi:hypothetical protein
MWSDGTNRAAGGTGGSAAGIRAFLRLDNTVADQPVGHP